MEGQTSFKKKKSFNFRRFKQRHIALKILYFGWDYDGLAEQAESKTTIEYHLFKALITTCLIESRQECAYNRCGRTDKGVSSYGQVVNLNVRSNLVNEDNPNNIGLFTPIDYAENSDNVCDEQVQEINYVDILNRVLPDHIRILAWAPVHESFSSRFDCQNRSYSYIFPRGNLHIESIGKSLSYLIGDHDFRNLCSFDLKNGVTNHRRTIFEAYIRPLKSLDDQEKVATVSQYCFYEVVIVGKAFLYHQIRCIMSAVFLVGTGKEQPELIRDLLDMGKCSSRPNYNRASALPLSLFDCQYKADHMPLGWIYDDKSVTNIHKHLKQIWLRHKTKVTMIEQAMLNFEKNCSVGGEPGCWKDFGLEFDTMSDKKYVPILERPRGDTLEEMLQALNAKQQKLFGMR